MQTLAQIKEILESRGLRPLKSLGQNFLTDHNLIRKLVDAAAVRPGDTVLEVGPGTGTMTEELIARGARVVAAEMDRGLSEHLREHFSAEARFQLVEGDCLASKREIAPAIMAAIGDGPFTLVSNLPYGAGTPVMMTLLADHPRCSGLFVTIQREVAERLRAPHASKDYGPLSVLAGCTAEFEWIADLPPQCFWPRPEITSAMVALRRRTVPHCSRPRELLDFLVRVFEQRRKQLGAVLGRSTALPEGIEPAVRAEALPKDQLIRLFEFLHPA
ncbi:MAG: 16S rRNA (adenine(1518)-N(6)/adenine(1519)-N(6))-dimethyltransferase RsmA [Phycisphaerales bacterium]